MAYMTATAVRAASTLINDDDRFTDALIEDLVAEFEGIFEDAAPYAAVPRTVEGEQFESPSNGRVTLPWTHIRTVDAVYIEGDEIDADHLASLKVNLKSGVVSRLWAPHGTEVTVDYTHGLDAPTVGIERACVEYVRAAGLEALSKKPRTTIGFSDDSGFTFRESTPDKDQGRWTGFIVVDRLINAQFSSSLGFA